MNGNDPFFVGYLKVPRALRGFLWTVAAALVAAAAGLGYLVGAAQDDPGDGAGLGRQTVTGVVELTPTPVLRVTEGSQRIPTGHTLMMSGQGKNGTAARAVPLQGQLVRASGLLLRRGDLDMLQLRNGRNGLRPAQGSLPDVPPPQPLGRWRLTGEICDGKCTAGIMRPGRGISHKACAELCIAGGIPPVFVTTQPVEGAGFLMISGTADDALPAPLYDWVGLYVTLEGAVARHGDLLVLDVTPGTVELAR